MKSDERIGYSKTERKRGRPKGSGSQTVYNDLRDRILTLQLRPGVIIDELSLVERFKLSRTPVREALIKLEMERLVEIVPNRGARVASMDFENIGRLFEALDLYSRAIAHLASRRSDSAAIERARSANQDFIKASYKVDFRGMGDANQRFHIELGEASGNPYLAEAQSRILNETMRLAYIAHYSSVLTKSDYRAYFNQIILEHNQLLECIQSGRSKEAEVLAGQHTRLFQETVAQYVLSSDLKGIDIQHEIGEKSSGTKEIVRHSLR